MGRYFIGDSCSVSPSEGSNCSDVSLSLTGEYIESYQGCYRICSEVGTSILGTVYRCLQVTTGKTFIAKHYSRDSLRSEDVSSKIENEMKIMKRLKHPNTVRLTEHLYTKHGLVLLSEHIKSRTLKDIVLKYYGLMECHIRKIFTQILNGLEYLHQHRVVHRDINLENISIDENGNVKIINYELAEYVPKNRQDDGSLVVKTECGKLKYLAPEVIESNGEYYRGDLADIWAAGVVLYVLTTGYFPFAHHKERTNRRMIRYFECYKFDAMKRNLIHEDSPGVEMSDELRHLLRHIFVRTPSDRPSIAKIKNHSWMRGVKFQDEKKRPTKTFKNKAGDVSVTLRDSKIERSRSLLEDCDNSQTSRNPRGRSHRRIASEPHDVEKKLDITWESVMYI